MMTTEAQEVLHKLHFPELPYYLEVYIKIDDTTDTVSAEVHSRVHVERVTKVPTQWTIDFFRDKRSIVRGDISSYAIRAYGLELMPTKYW
jgi:hypothetical protein